MRNENVKEVNDKKPPSKNSLTFLYWCVREMGDGVGENMTTRNKYTSTRKETANTANDKIV